MVFNIGCIECGVSSKIVGIFESEVDAAKLAKELSNSHHWREGGQNAFEVFKLPEVGIIDPEYLESRDET